VTLEKDWRQPKCLGFYLGRTYNSAGRVWTVEVIGATDEYA